MTEQELNELAFRRRLVSENIQALRERARCTMNSLDRRSRKCLSIYQHRIAQSF